MNQWNEMTVLKWNEEATLAYDKLNQLKESLSLTIQLKNGFVIKIKPSLSFTHEKTEHKINVKDFNVHISDADLKYWNFYANELFPAQKSWNTISDEIYYLGLRIKQELKNWLAGERDTFLDPEEFEDYKDDKKKLDMDKFKVLLPYKIAMGEIDTFNHIKTRNEVKGK